MSDSESALSALLSVTREIILGFFAAILFLAALKLLFGMRILEDIIHDTALREKIEYVTGPVITMQEKLDPGPFDTIDPLEPPKKHKVDLAVGIKSAVGCVDALFAGQASCKVNRVDVSTASVVTYAATYCVYIVLYVLRFLSALLAGFFRLAHAALSLITIAFWTQLSTNAVQQYDRWSVQFENESLLIAIAVLSFILMLSRFLSRHPAASRNDEPPQDSDIVSEPIPDDPEPEPEEERRAA